MKIRRIRCLECSRTHAVLPAFLLGQVRCGAGTLTPYLALAETQSLWPVSVWQQNLSDGPEDISLLYRWLRRLRVHLSTLLPFLQNKLLELAPDSELGHLETAILKATESKMAMTKPFCLCLPKPLKRGEGAPGYFKSYMGYVKKFNKIAC